jgi:hypothetical protein
VPTLLILAASSSQLDAIPLLDIEPGCRGASSFNLAENQSFAELFALTSEMVEARLHNARSLLVEVLIRQFGPAFGGVFQLGDSRCERITNAVMDRLFPRR